jgi:hypothetical protein
MFQGPIAKLTIGSLDAPTANFTVIAQYNPKELDLAKSSTWQDNAAINAAVELEFRGNPSRTLALELFFDGNESNKSIEPHIQALQELASPRDEDSKDPEWSRPHLCVVVWNDGEMPKFKCVIESIAVKYTMFSPQGRPLRAVCQVKLKEAKVRSPR